MLKRLLLRLKKFKDEKVKVVRKRNIGNLVWVQVYLNENDLPFEFLVPNTTPDETLIQFARNLKEFQDKYGLA